MPFLNNRKGQIVCASIRYCAPQPPEAPHPHSRDCDRPRKAVKGGLGAKSDNGVGGRAGGEGGIREERAITMPRGIRDCTASMLGLGMESLALSQALLRPPT